MTAEFFGFTPRDFLLGAFGIGGAYVLIRERLRQLKQDVNGVGRNLRKSVACELRCAAEETPINKGKLLHLADLIDPK